MKKVIIFVLLVLTIIPSSLFAETEAEPENSKKHHVGIRLGTWGNSGDTHLESYLFSPTDSLTTSIKNVNVYIEGFYAYNIYASIYSEISFGVVNRGDMQYFSALSSDLSNLLIYPILVQFKFYPFQSAHSKFQPFLGGGGGVYFAKQDIQFTTDYLANYYEIQGESETTFNYVISAGFDWKIADKFALELQTKYMPINFSDHFAMEKDYSSTTITIGFKYKYNNIKK